MVQLSHKKHVKLVNDYEAAASAANLVYVSDKDPGISRIKWGKKFRYECEEKIIKEKELLERIRKLAIPPAWEKVWICLKQNGHIQATGYDVKQRKQYRYHPSWYLLRNETKFHKLLEFSKVLPLLREQVNKDLAISELCEKKVLAAVIKLMECTYIRIGNSSYEKMNGSHGITTMHDKHVVVEGEQISFSFKGKKSIHHEISIKNKKLAKVVQLCKDIPGKELFQYYDKDQQRKSIDSGMVNAYIKEITGDFFTAKDFRTWAGCLHLLTAFKEMEMPENSTSCKKNINAALDYVSGHLGNTRTVCRKYYVHPGIIRLYEENQLDKCLNQLTVAKKDHTHFTPEESALVKLLSQV